MSQPEVKREVSCWEKLKGDGGVDGWEREWEGNLILRQLREGMRGRPAESSCLSQSYKSSQFTDALHVSFRAFLFPFLHEN